MRFCSGCGKPVGDRDNFCPHCGASIRGENWEVKVVGADAKEVQAVAESLVNDMSKREVISPKNPWISGSFYLATVVIVGALFLVMAKIVHILVLPIIIIGVLLMVSVVGAFQLRQDKSLSEKNFLNLMFMTFKYLPFIRKQDSIKKDSHRP